jgi:hypothetical protein
MPTISQLPPANAVSATDEVPISQAGTARSASVGELLASVQPVITVDSASLLGRTSMGPGGPEQVDLGLGVSLSGGTLVADGLDHAAFAVIPSLSLESDLVISNRGVPTLMQASLLRGLFAAGQNVAIDANGVISATAGVLPPVVWTHGRRYGYGSGYAFPNQTDIASVLGSVKHEPLARRPSALLDRPCARWLSVRQVGTAGSVAFRSNSRIAHAAIAKVCAATCRVR